MPGDIFEVNTKPAFPHEKREIPVYFEYPESVLDAVRVMFPASLAVESIPATQQLQLEKVAAYGINSESNATGVVIHRNFLLGDILFTPQQFPDLRAFYNKAETRDQEPIVLKVVTAGATGQ